MSEGGKCGNEYHRADDRALQWCLVLLKKLTRSSSEVTAFCCCYCQICSQKVKNLGLTLEFVTVLCIYWKHFVGIVGDCRESIKKSERTANQEKAQGECL